MTRISTCSALTLAVALGWALPAQAQESVSAAENSAAVQGPQVSDSKEDGFVTSVFNNGAPVIEVADGWTIKPRGRLQYDWGHLDAPLGEDRQTGWDSELRRARIGVEGKIPANLSYKVEVDLTHSNVTLMDAEITYDMGNTKIRAGQHNTFQGLDELTSSLHNSFIERSAFTDAFNFIRRVGLSVEHRQGDLLLEGGFFGNNVELEIDGAWSVDGRAVYAPKVGDTQLHVGGSVHYRELSDLGKIAHTSRPSVHFNNNRFLNTRVIEAESEFGVGLEAAAIRGPFHVEAEAYRQHLGGRPEAGGLTFFGGSIEAGYFLTKGDHRGYKNGIFDRVKPKNPLGQGGIGAVQVNVRYDYLDLNDKDIVGGIQNAYEASLIWTPTARTRFLAQYSHLDYDDAAILGAAGQTSYGANVVAMRAQFDF